MDSTESNKVQTLNQFGFGLDQSVLLQVLRSNGGDIDKATDELLTMAARLDRTQITGPQSLPPGSDEEAQNMRAFSIEAKPAVSNQQNVSSQAHQSPSSIPSSPVKSPAAPSAPAVDLLIAPAALIPEKEPESIYRSAASSLSEIVDLPPISENQTASIQVSDAAARNSSSELRSQSAAVVAPLEPYSFDDDLDLNVPEPEIVEKPHDDLMPGRFFIYKRQDLTKKAIDEIVAIKAFLAQQKLTDFSEVDLTHDHELAGFIKAKCGGKLTFPVVFLKTHFIGSLEELKEAQKSGRLQKLVDDDLKASGNDSDRMECAPELQLNVLDKCLNAAETVLTWLNPVSWLWRSKPQEAPKDVVDFEVVQSNWYWRHQRRKLRFAQDFFLRLHPTYMDVRAAHKIDAIASISVSDEYNIVLRYKDGSSPDFIRCRREDLPRIIEIVKTRSAALGAEVPIMIAPGVVIGSSQ